jgi:glycosyltransferase A (GT-A) superfamily protein (DUF2064 family)
VFFTIDVFAQALSQPGQLGRRLVAVVGSEQATDVAGDVEDLVVLVHRVRDRFDASASAEDLLMCAAFSQSASHPPLPGPSALLAPPCVREA